MTMADQWASALMMAKKAFDNAFLVNDRYIIPITTEAIVEIAKAMITEVRERYMAIKEVGDADGRKDKKT